MANSSNEYSLIYGDILYKEKLEIYVMYILYYTITGVHYLEIYLSHFL